MNDKIITNLIRVIRFLGILIGAILIFISLKIVIFSSGVLSYTSFLQRAYSFIPFVAFGIMLIIPYKCIKKKKLLVYLCSLIFILLFIGAMFYFYRASWHPIYPNGSIFKITISDLIPLGAFLIFILNIWAFIRITRHKET